MHDDAFQISFQQLPTEARVAAFRGREAMSAPHRFDVDIVVPGLDATAVHEAVLDRPAVLAIAANDPAGRRIGGRVTAVRWLGVLAKGELSGRVRIAAPLAGLGRTRRSRIFQSRTTQEIVAFVLREHGVAHRFAVAAELSPRVYAVQYRETDLAFVERLLAEEGLFYFHEDPLPPAFEPTLVIADEPAAYGLTAGKMPLVARDASPGMVPEEHHVHEMTAERRVAPRAVRLRGFDPMRPRAAHEAWAAAEPFGLSPSTQGEPPPTDDERSRFYEHGEDVGPRGPRLPLPTSSAGVRLEQLRRKVARAFFHTPCRRLAPGHTFVLAEHEIAELDRPWVVTRIAHEGVEAQRAGGREPYRAEVTAAPATMRVRPRAPRRPVVQVAETAIVVGPAGVASGEPHVDEHGRIQVQFPWDPDGDGAAGTSCWIRVTQAWAGEGWGTQFIPRVGMEVLVTFLGGDPDRPVVVGALPNPINPLPQKLPRGAAMSGIKTRSTPGGEGANELLFCDAKGAEELVLRGERDVEVLAKNDLRMQAGGTLSLDTSGNRTTSIGGTDRLTVDGDRRTEIQGSCDTTVFEDLSSTSYRDIALSASENVRIDSGANTFVTARDSLVVDVTDNATLRAGTGDSTFQITASGTLVLEASEALHLTSSKKLVFQVGPTKLTISADGVKVEGAAIGLKATDGFVAEGPGPKLSLSDRAELVSEEISLISKDAEIKLTNKAEIKATDIKLGGKKKDPEKGKDDEKPKTKKLKAKVADPDFEPYADKKFEVMAGGARIEGTTGIDGEVEAEIPEEADVANLKVWIDEYPTGRTRTWILDVVELPPAKEPKGALVRLKNLGYLTTEPGDVIDAPARAAIVWFQNDHELEASGELDDETVAKIEEVHGS